GVPHVMLERREAEPSGTMDETVLVQLARQDVSRARAALTASGFAPVGWNGARLHFAGYDRMSVTWTRVDVRLAPASGIRRRADAVMARLLMLRLRRPGMVVALLGPDGAGKTTLADALTRELPLRARRVYMGTNPAAGDSLALR